MRRQCINAMRADRFHDSIVSAGWLAGGEAMMTGTGSPARYEIGAERSKARRVRAVALMPCKLLRNLFFDSRVRARSRLYSQPYIRMECRRFRRLSSLFATHARDRRRENSN